MILTEEKIKKYFEENINFSLKDFYKTHNKYKNYKTKEFKLFLDKYKEEVKQHLDNLSFNIVKWFNDNPLKYINDLEFNNKSNIRILKTWVNSITQELNYKFIKGLINANNNTYKNFNIKFYLYYYKEINQIMKDSLKQKLFN